MVMLIFLIFFLIFFVPGLISVLAFKHVSYCKISNGCKCIAAAFIFDLLIMIINLAALCIFKGICKLNELICYFNNLDATLKFSVVSIILGIVLGLIAGIIFRLFFWRKHFRCM